MNYALKSSAQAFMLGAGITVGAGVVFQQQVNLELALILGVVCIGVYWLLAWSLR